MQKHTSGRDDLIHTLLDEADQRRLVAALAGLSGAHQQTLLSTLTQVEVRAVKEWLATGVLHEWVKQGLYICGKKK